MKKNVGTTLALVGLLALAFLASSCSDDPAPALTVEFSGCDFAGATVARVEMFQGLTPVAHGAGTLTGGAALFQLYDTVTGAVWFPTLGVTYNARGYCFAGSVGDPVPAGGYWQATVSDYTQYQESAYAEIEFENGYFTYVP